MSLPGRLEATDDVMVPRADATVVKLLVAAVAGATVDVSGLPIEVPNLFHRPSKPPTLLKPCRDTNEIWEKSEHLRKHTFLEKYILRLLRKAKRKTISRTEHEK